MRRLLFPIGFATPKSKLKRDQAICQSFYPDGEGELYYRPSGSEEAKTMVSFDGEDYAEQSFAFAYRSSYQPACAAMLHAGGNAATEEERKIVAIKASRIVSIPVPRPSPSAHDTIAGADDHSTVASADADTRVRVVGPQTPYLVSEPAEQSTAPVAANSAPRRVAPAEPGIVTFWLDRIASLIAPAAQAGDRPN